MTSRQRVGAVGVDDKGDASYESPLPAKPAGNGAPVLFPFWESFFIFLRICLRLACQKIPIRRLVGIGALWIAIAFGIHETQRPCTRFWIGMRQSRSFVGMTDAEEQSE